MSLKSWVSKKMIGLATQHATVRGFAVTVVNTRPDIDTADVLARLDAALLLLERYVPHHSRRMRRDLNRILVQRYACRGAYFDADRSCMVELTFVVNRAFSPGQIAATILHEAMHARLARIGYPYDKQHRARQERFCRRAEIDFGKAVPGGEAIVERALDALEGTDDDVAPAIDNTLAAQRVAQADFDAWRAPRWLKQLIAKRRGLDA